MIIQIIESIKKLTENWCFHQEGFIQITQLLCGKTFITCIINILINTILGLYCTINFIILDAFHIVNKNNLNEVCTNNLLMIIWSLQNVLNNKKCGPTMVCAFVDLLGHFASVRLKHKQINFTFFKYYILILIM